MKKTTKQNCETDFEMVRKSPVEHAKMFKHSRKKGLDGNMWTSEPDVNGVFRWKRTVSSARSRKRSTRKKSTRKKSTHKPSVKKSKRSAVSSGPDVTLKMECLLRFVNANGTFRFGYLNLNIKES